MSPNFLEDSNQQQPFSYNLTSPTSAWRSLTNPVTWTKWWFPRRITKTATNSLCWVVDDGPIHPSVPTTGGSGLTDGLLLFTSMLCYVSGLISCTFLTLTPKNIWLSSSKLKIQSAFIHMSNDSDWRWWKHVTWVTKTLMFRVFPAQCYDANKILLSHHCFERVKKTNQRFHGSQIRSLPAANYHRTCATFTIDDKQARWLTPSTDFVFKTRINFSFLNVVWWDL